jgi:hypothetical protein
MLILEYFTSATMMFQNIARPPCMVTCPGLYRFPGNALKIISYVSDRQGIPLLCQDSLLSGRTGLLGMARGKILALMQAAGQAHNTNRRPVIIEGSEG